MMNAWQRGREFQIIGLLYWKDLSPRVLLPILGTQYLRLSEESEKESRGEATQKGMEELYQGHCQRRWELFLICFSARQLVVIQLLWRHRIGGWLWLGFCHWQSAPMCLALMLMPMATLPTAPVWVRTDVDPSLAPLRLLTLASGYVALCVWLLTLMPVVVLPYVFGCWP